MQRGAGELLGGCGRDAARCTEVQSGEHRLDGQGRGVACAVAIRHGARLHRRPAQHERAAARLAVRLVDRGLWVVFAPPRLIATEEEAVTEEEEAAVTEEEEEVVVTEEEEVVVTDEESGGGGGGGGGGGDGGGGRGGVSSLHLVWTDGGAPVRESEKRNWCSPG